MLYYSGISIKMAASLLGHKDTKMIMQVCDLDDTGYTLPQMRALMMLGHKAMLAAEREGKPMPEKVKKVYVKAKKYKTGKGRQPKK